MAYIEDIIAVLGKNPTVPSGYKLIPKDLNEDAGGQYIYLAVSTTDNIAKAISGVNVFADSKAAGWPIQRGYDSIQQNLSEGAMGKYVYLCTTKNMKNKPITGLTVISGSSSCTYPADPSWIRIEQDCNEDAGGKFVYVCYSYTMDTP